MAEKSLKILVIGAGPGDPKWVRAINRLKALDSEGKLTHNITFEPATLPNPEPKQNATLFFDECLPFSKEKFDHLQPARSKFHK